MYVYFKKSARSFLLKLILHIYSTYPLWPFRKKKGKKRVYKSSVLFQSFHAFSSFSLHFQPCSLDFAFSTIFTLAFSNIKGWEFSLYAPLWFMLNVRNYGHLKREDRQKWQYVSFKWKFILKVCCVLWNKVLWKMVDNKTVWKENLYVA